MTEVRTYDVTTARPGTLRNLLPIFGFPALIWRNRFMVQNFFRRELLGRFHGSFLGAYWILIQPLFLFAVYYFVFGLLFGSHKIDQPPDKGFAIYLFSGVIVFHAIMEALGQSCPIVNANGNLVKKVAFPSEVLVIPVALVSLVIYGVGALVCLAAGTALGVLEPGLPLLTLPLILLIQFTFTVGLGLTLANLDVFIRDTTQLWRIASTAWMFLTPIFWRPTMLFDKVGPEYHWLADLFFSLNPMYSILQAHRIALGGTDPVLGDLWTHIGLAALWALGFIVLGYSTFTGHKHKYADLV